MKLRVITFLLICTSVSVYGQDEESEPKKFTFKGYLKDMASLNNLGDSLLFQNLIHNRLNFAWYPNKEFTFYVEVRSRFISGDFVKKIPGYGTLLNSNNDYFTLSQNFVDSKSGVLNVMADRVYVQWTKNNWEVKAGRQRINWGVNLAWNPNDWFNAYSFFDFDYEERPGSDALRISRYTGVASSVEVAAKAADDMDHFVGASMWRVNKWNYDLQFLGGIAQGDLALGTGWAGNLKGASFKGELSYFHKVVDTQINSNYENMFLGAISIDYSFENSLYLNGSVMYNSQGSSNQGFGFTLFGARPGTVRSLSPYTWSAFVQSTYQITPLFNTGFAIIDYPGSKAFFINPSLSYSLMQSLDLDLIGQLFYGEDFKGDFGSLVKSIYLRLKWSF